MADALLWAVASVGAACSLAAGQPELPAPAAIVLLLEESLVVCLLVADALVDVRRGILPDGIALGIAAVHAAATAARCALGAADPFASAASALVGAAALGGGLLAFTLAYERLARKPGMGGGDIKLVFALGFALGLPRAALALLAACLAFALHMAARAVRERGRRRAAPRADAFGPALAIGAYAVLAWL